MGSGPRRSALWALSSFLAAGLAWALVTAGTLVDPPIQGPGFIQGGPNVTNDGADFFVSWYEARQGYAHSMSAARVDVGGAVLDPLGISLASDPETLTGFSAAASGGGQYGVAWDQYDFLRNIFGIAFRRIGSDGTPLDPSPKILAPSFEAFVAPGVAFGGGRFLVSWSDFFNNGAGSAALVDLDGGIGDGGPFILTPGSAGSFLQTVAAAGVNQFLVALQAATADGGGNHVYGVRVTPSGTVLDSSPFGVSTSGSGETQLAITFSNNLYFVAWSDQRNGSSDIYGARVTLDGGLLDPQGIPISTAAGPQVSPALAAIPAGVLVVWADGRASPPDLYGAQVSSTGAVSPLFGPVSGSAKGAPGVSCIGTQCLVAWEDTPAGAREAVVEVSPLSADGGPSAPNGIPVALTANAQTLPSVAAGQGRFLIIFDDGRAQVVRVFAASYDSNGCQLGAPAPILGDPSYRFPPSLAYGAGHFAVTSVSAGGIALARIDPDGGVLDPGGVPVSIGHGPDPESPGIASNGRTYLVAWEDDRGNPAFVEDIYAARVAADGGLLDTTNLQLTTDGGAKVPAIASDGNGYLVVWTRGNVPGQAIEGARVSAAGSLLDRPPLRISAGSNARVYPSAGFDGRQYWVVWEDDRAGGPGHPGIYGARVSVDGGIVDPSGVPLASVAPRSVHPRVQCGPGGCLLTWLDNRSGQFDLYGADLSPDGGVLEPGGLLLSGAPGDKGFGAAASLASGTWLVTDQRFVAQTGVARVETQMYFADGGGGPSCGSSGDAGGAPDAGQGDAGTGADGGFLPGAYGVGCGCSSRGAAMPSILAAMALLLIAAVRSTRRSDGTRPLTLRVSTAHGREQPRAPKA